ncbi:XdhC family protein [Arenibacter certesii]|uniref:Xanthine and CO dehydrogenase family maturation factor XdhC/CoxF family protein n=1 Tax=Arenibacter certesii TaxID=228955 RepID=A0A918J2Q9_9FLAO|nr:XdhC/CoxI family protein [Arenibacter certesii]GGW44269.1 xanthine and CO dehydrogenase family maturation factor XdhC/CoxF family protein [Arenibacter certesii]
MLHELKNIIKEYQQATLKGKQCVLATVVALDGSSYRRPGVRMLILEDGRMVGAVSGGCVEKEVLRQAQSVFKDNTAKVISYDGRYRLGCEGVLYILLEPFRPDTKFLEAFNEALKLRCKFKVVSIFEKKEALNKHFGSVVDFGNTVLPFYSDFEKTEDLELFEQEMETCFKLFIIGAEHDAVQLNTLASQIGWEVTIIADPAEEKNILDFEGAHDFMGILPDEFPFSTIDNRTAIVLMNHSYSKDLRYLMVLKDVQPLYLGLLGPHSRREKLFNELLELSPLVSYNFLERIHGPAGLNLGAETPQEIAVAIIAEIMSVLRKQQPIPLKDKKKGIHD